jgi:hypothetical protein
LSFFGAKMQYAGNEFAKARERAMPYAASADDIDIIRLNIERYRRLLKTEVDESARLLIQKILKEFEAKLSTAARKRDAPDDLIYINGRHAVKR